MQREFKVNIEQATAHNEIKPYLGHICIYRSNLLIVMDVNNNRMLQIYLHCPPLLVSIVNNKLLFPMLMIQCN